MWLYKPPHKYKHQTRKILTYSFWSVISIPPPRRKSSGSSAANNMSYTLKDQLCTAQQQFEKLISHFNFPGSRKKVLGLMNKPQIQMDLCL